MDIGNIIELETADIVIKHPTTGKDTDLTVTVYAPHTDTFRKAATELVENKIDGMEFLAKCVKGWKNLKRNGKVVKFSTKEAVKLFKEASWLHKQVDSFVARSENFLQVS